MRVSQRGLGWFGFLIVIAIAVAVGYYAWKGITGGDEPPSCRSAFNTCMKTCRRTSTEAPAALACQQDCQRELDDCERRGK
jgi:hypothetical protein